ncbi:DUF1127 domain-containing protein [Sediminimonas sp.]|uniref:DUF1127 domain-containing protein n=1 Tax=Sediminimonas sp. TaxID=2823379 RepID=UPI0025E43615|nr:DUF1127 domain-containing protein [Sediminimonas sp.]
MTTLSSARRETTCTTAHRPGPLARVRSMLAVRAQRRALARLDDRTLRDIGLTRDAARSEARRPIWDVPHYWLR